VYTTDGDLNIDNNASENALRRVAIGRKNWRFCGSDNGGMTASVLFSLIATCQRARKGQEKVSGTFLPPRPS